LKKRKTQDQDSTDAIFFMEFPAGGFVIRLGKVESDINEKRAVDNIPREKAKNDVNESREIG